ncbi:hypothetical protein ACFLSJ_00510 [Verrucomicrobiota bacterium]
MIERGTMRAVLAVSTLMAVSALAGPTALEYGDGKADGKKSLGGDGEMIKFTLPTGPGSMKKVAGIRIHGSRYGHPKPPEESFYIFIMDEELGMVHMETAPYSLFERGDQKWVRVRFKDSVNVPAAFWVVLDFKAHRTKGVYVSYDTSTGGENSRAGLPGKEPRDVDFGGDWMIRVDLSR